MLEKLLDAIKARFPLTGNEGATRQFQVMGMTFEARAYAARGLGHVGVMTARGPMQMETLVINPFERDAPILSYDRIHAMGQETVIAEMYDSLLGDSFCADGIVQTLGESAAILEKEQEDWYAPLIVRPWLHRKGNTEEAERYDAIAADYVEAYLAAAQAAEPCDPDQKRRKAAAYSKGLLEHGGPATDPVKAATGEEFTSALFRETLFGA
jgi:hypothetical protein